MQKNLLECKKNTIFAPSFSLIYEKIVCEKVHLHSTFGAF